MKTFLIPLSPEEEADCLNRLKNGDRMAEEDTEDLISIGTIGLLKAVNSFKHDYGSRFATYAIRCIDNEMLMYFRNKRKYRGEVSLFEPIGVDKEGNQIQLLDVLEFHDRNVVDDVEKKEQIVKINQNMKRVLTKRELYIVKKRYGMDGTKEMTQREIAKELGISRSYVSRIEKKALNKLKKIICE